MHVFIKLTDEKSFIKLPEKRSFSWNSKSAFFHRHLDDENISQELLAKSTWYPSRRKLLVCANFI